MTSSAEPVAAALVDSHAPHIAADKAGPRTRQRIPPVAGVLLIAALWLITRPYRGVRHDGILYLGQTLAHFMPDTIGRDMFLAFGSQDRYSIFSLLMAPLVQTFGISNPELVILAICQVAFVSGCWLLTTGLPSLTRWCSLISLIALAHTYAGGGGSFGFAEPFLSGRSMAEPLALLSIALFLRGSTAWALLPILGALSLHALIALPALVTMWIALCLQDRRWLAGLVVVAAAGVAGAMGMAPFDGIWRRFDPVWWENVRVANQNVFFFSTRSQDWATAAFDALVLVRAMPLLAGSALARLVKALLICAPALTLVWALGADLLHDVLLTQLQLWRIFWLFHLFAILLLPSVLADLWGRPQVGRLAASAFVLATVAVSANLSTSLLCLLWALLPLGLLRSPASVSPALIRLATIVSVTAMLVVSTMVGWTTHSAVATFPERFNGASDVQIVLGLSIVVSAIGYAMLRGLATAGPTRWAVYGVLLALLGCGCTWWDQRSDWQRYVENGLHETGLPFKGMIPASATVYWEDSLIEPWLLMQRQQFFTPEQGAGLLFSRGTAIEFVARENAVRPMLLQQQVCKTVLLLTASDDLGQCNPSLEVMRDICRAQLRHPDYLVFYARPGTDGEGAAATWTFRPGDPLHSRSYRLYDCAKLR